MASGHRIVNAYFTMLHHSRDPGKLNLHASNFRLDSVFLMLLRRVTNNVAEHRTINMADYMHQNLLSAELFGVVLHRYLAAFLHHYLALVDG